MKQQFSKSDQTFVVTGIASYVNVLTPRAAVEGAEPKYSMQIIIDKDDRKSLDAAEKGVEAAKQNSIATFGGKIPSNLKLPFRDGDEERGDLPEYKNKMFANANSKKRPDIVDKKLDAVIDANDIYSGMKVRAKITAFGYSVNGNKGVGLSLGNIQKIGDGDPLGGASRSAADDFDVYKESTADMLS